MGRWGARDGVLDCEVVQVELVRNRVNLVERRTVEADPGHTFPFAQRLVGLLETLGIGAAAPVDVDGIVDQRESALSPAQSSKRYSMPRTVSRWLRRLRTGSSLRRNRTKYRADRCSRRGQDGPPRHVALAVTVAAP